MVLQGLSRTIFAIRPWEFGADRSCAALRARLAAATHMFTDEKTLAIVQGYRSIVCALSGVAVAQDSYFREAADWLKSACEIAQEAYFTRGWSAKERQLAFEVDYALVLYLSGQEVLALRHLRQEKYQDHIVANFTVSRILIETGRVPQIRYGVEFLRNSDNIHRLSLYSEELAHIAEQIANAARRRQSFPTDQFLKPRSLGWWVDKQGWKGRG